MADDSEVNREEDGLGTAERPVYAALVALIAVAAPLLFYFVSVPRIPGDPWAIPWVVAPILGPMIFQLLSRPRPTWGHGLAFAAGLAVVFGIWAGIRPPFEYSGAGQAALGGAYVFVLVFMVGMGGASIASLLVRAFTPRRAWLVGVVITALGVVASAVLTAVLIQ